MECLDNIRAMEVIHRSLGDQGDKKAIAGYIFRLRLQHLHKRNLPSDTISQRHTVQPMITKRLDRGTAGRISVHAKLLEGASLEQTLIVQERQQKISQSTNGTMILQDEQSTVRGQYLRQPGIINPVQPGHVDHLQAESPSLQNFCSAQGLVAA